MRTLTGVSRLFLLAAISVAALLVFGGAYFIGYVGQLERELSDPESASQRTATQIAIIEHALGHAGFLKSYRDYWTGDTRAQAELGKRSAEAVGALKALDRLTVGEATSTTALREVEAVVDTFTQTAAAAPATPPSGLRGVTDDSVKALPSAGQLETAYLTLATSFERLRETGRSSQLRGLGGLLDSALILIVITLAALVAGLLIVAWVMRFGVIQPLNTLERSLSAAAKGFVAHRIWGTDRRDEIGELARAGEAMRRGLADMPALKTLADQGQIHETLEGAGSTLFEKLAAQVTSAVEALKAATGDATEIGVARRTELNTAITQLGQACGDIQAAATSLRSDFGQVIETVRASSQTLLSAATDGANQVGQVAGRLANGSEELAGVSARAKERVNAVLSELTTTAQGLRQASEDAKQSQTVFFAAHDHIASDVAQTNEAVRGLGARLGGLLSGTEEHLARILGTLDRLEKGLDQTVAGLQSRTIDTTQALARATTTFDERTAAAEKRFAASMSEFAQASKALGSDSEGLRHYLGQVVGDVRGARRMLEDIVGTLMADGGIFAEMAARLKKTNERLNNLNPDEEMRNAIMADLKAIAETVNNAAEKVRGEISRLIEHVDEERLLPSRPAGEPIALLEGPSARRESPRTLAEVPKAEVLERLGDLAAEMHAVTEDAAHTEDIKSALAGLADEMRQLGNAPETRRTSDELSATLTRHAAVIEAHAARSAPTRDELDAMARELRQVMVRAKNGSGAGAAQHVAEAAERIEERARRLFAQLEATDGIQEEDLSLESATADVEALATLVAKLEARAEAFSEQAIARRFEEASNKGSPVELTEKAFAADQRTDGAIQAVFEAIERLNNIAAALARAGDAERQRRLAH